MARMRKLYILPVIAILAILWVVYLRPEQKPQESPIDASITTLLESLEVDPTNTQARILLGQAYLQKVRETADVAYYQKIDQLIADLGNNIEADVLDASVALGRHDFEKARDVGLELTRSEPRRASHWGILSDAYIELGEYKKAEEALQMMVNLKPDFASYSRVSYLRELHGDITGAKEAMEQAIAIGGAFPEHTAWAMVELGKLQFRDNLGEAESYFKAALGVLPEYPPALHRLGRIAVAREDFEAGEIYLQRALKQLPIAEYAIALGELYERKGDLVKASQNYTLASLAFDASVAAGTNVDLERAAFLAEHDLDPQTALAAARRAFRDRPSVYAADAYALALLQNGNAREAQVVMKKALRLGEYDPQIVYHAQAIERALGNTEEANRLAKKAFELSPHFSIRYIQI